MTTPSLHAKLATIYAEVERIAKTGEAPESMGRYHFAEAAEVAAAIRKHFAALHVTMFPCAEVIDRTEHGTAKGGIMTTIGLRVVWTLTDGDSGETATITSIGYGSDTGDKFASKATTSAMKYELLSAVLIPTGDDIEAEETSAKTARPASTAPTCPDHHTAMREGNRPGEWFCPRKLDAGGFCTRKHRAPANDPAQQAVAQATRPAEAQATGVMTRSAFIARLGAQGRLLVTITDEERAKAGLAEKGSADYTPSDWHALAVAVGIA